MKPQDLDDVPVIINGKLYPRIQVNSLDEIATTAAVLGVLGGASVVFMCTTGYVRIPLYICALSLFHFLEFWTTAKYNPGKVHTDSFIIRNGKAYVGAHCVALLEALVEEFFNVRWVFPKATFVVGIFLMLVGQYVRSLAMVTAGKSFSHTVKFTKNVDHELVTTGVYAWSRHPSYFGFFWWAIGTQLMLLNPVSLVGFAIVLWRFFEDRISYEESYLIQFFGRKYLDYKSKVTTGIPFI